MQHRDGPLERRVLTPLESLEDEVCPLRTGGEPRAASLAPVPASARHARVVAPDNLTGERVLDACPIHGFERFRAGRQIQSWNTDHSIEVFGADRDHRP